MDCPTVFARFGRGSVDFDELFLDERFLDGLVFDDLAFDDVFPEAFPFLVCERPEEVFFERPLLLFAERFGFDLLPADFFVLFFFFERGVEAFFVDFFFEETGFLREEVFFFVVFFLFDFFTLPLVREGGVPAFLRDFFVVLGLREPPRVVFVGSFEVRVRFDRFLADLEAEPFAAEDRFGPRFLATSIKPFDRILSIRTSDGFLLG